MRLSAVLFHKQGHFVAAIIFAFINKYIYIYKTSLMFYCCFCGWEQTKKALAVLSAHNHILHKVKVNICMESCLFAQFRLCDYFEFLQDLKIENEIPGWTDNSGYTRSRLTFLWTEQKNGLFAKIPSEMVFYPCSHGSWMPLSPLLLCLMKCGWRSWFIHGPMDHEYH